MIELRTACRESYQCNRVGWMVRVTGIVQQALEDDRPVSSRRVDLLCSGAAVCGERFGCGACPYPMTTDAG